jgi:hypothetical protein
VREPNRQFCKVLRTFEPSRFADDMLTTSYQKLVPILRRRTSRAMHPDTRGVELSPQCGCLRGNAGGAQ